ncbi:unnamed protein product [Victoria cruziana]
MFAATPYSAPWLHSCTRLSRPFRRTSRVEPLISTFPSCKQKGGSPSPSSSSSSSSKKKRTGNNGGSDMKRRPPPAKTAALVPVPLDDRTNDEASSLNSTDQRPLHPLPKPPAGFILDADGRVVMASSRRIVTIVDSVNNQPLECVVRRVFYSSKGDECMLLCPVDTPVQILKSTNFDGWEALNDNEIDAIIPAAAYALAKIHMHLVLSGFCYTARGGFCYSEEDILEFRTDDGEEIDGLPPEGTEITCFHQDGAHFMIYTPTDPLLFVAVKDQNGLLKIAEDDLLEDPAIIGAIDEETEFNALVEEESALLESVLGER